MTIEESKCKPFLNLNIFGRWFKKVLKNQKIPGRVILGPKQDVERNKIERQDSFVHVI